MDGRDEELTTDSTDKHGLNFQLEFNGGRVFQPANW